jgi:hypothetical protein
MTVGESPGGIKTNQNPPNPPGLTGNATTTRPPTSHGLAHHAWILQAFEGGF